MIVLWVVLGLLALPLFALILLRVFPGPILAAVQRSATRSMNVETFNATGRYSHFGFRPVHREYQGEPLTWEGNLPEDLEGVYLRNGTNAQFDDSKFPHHVFNGAGMVHAVQFKNGEARYSNSFTRTARYQAQDQAGEEIYTEFGALVGTGKAGMVMLLWGLLRQRFGLSPKLEALEDGASTTAIIHHADKLYTLQETSRPFVLNTQVKDGWLHFDGSGAFERFGDTLNRPYTAHPKIDPETGDAHSVSTHLETGEVHYARVCNGRLVDHELLYTAKPAIAFIHDFFLTKNHFIFPETSLLFEPKMLFKDPASVFHFDPAKKMRFGVILRVRSAAQSSEPIWFETSMAGHIWHTINGWEETDDAGKRHLVLIAPVFEEYPSTIPIHTADEPHALLYKFRLDLETQTVIEERRLLDHSYERPSMNWAYLGQSNRYAYLLDEGKTGIMAAGTLKYDLQAEKELGYFDYDGAYGGEALFVAKAGAQEEDDGYLLDIIMQEHVAELVIVDAKDMQCLARVKLPQRVPFGVHSTWLDNDTIARLA